MSGKSQPLRVTSTPPTRKPSERTPLQRASSLDSKGVPGRDSSSSALSTTYKDPEQQQPSSCSKEQRRAYRLIFYIIASVIMATANSLSFKIMLDTYKSHDPDHPHDYSFFVNQFNVALYVCLALLIVVRRRIDRGVHWWEKQDLPFGALCLMGALDASGAILSTIGGVYTSGPDQTLLNQVIIPMTLVLSYVFLGQAYTVAQTLGAFIIFFGAGIAVLPSFRGGGAVAQSESTWLGITLFFSSIIPGAFSNVYKEYAFKTSVHTDIYYLTTCVSSIQVLFGFCFLPLLALPAFGGVPLSQLPTQLTLGWYCFLNKNSQPGDDCRYGFATMLSYVAVNFGYNVFQLLITKHGGATVLVISAALALPVTNMAFSWKSIMGEDAVPVNVYDVIALLMVLLGFLIYSALDDVIHRRGEKKRLPIQFAAGSMIYVRERSNSDPSTPGYTPMLVRTPRRRGTLDDQLGSGGTRTPPTKPMAIRVVPQDPRLKPTRRPAGDGRPLNVMARHAEEEIENTVSV